MWSSAESTKVSGMASSSAPPASSGSKRPGGPTTPGSVKKRPYRRTKRPKNYCDKSTVTTTTPTLANRPVNVYDAVLGECEDLLKASLEAQRLGRLKMASAYQLLLHTRLVGLGKRFDRASIAPPLQRRRSDDDDYDDEDDDERVYNESDEDTETTPLASGGTASENPNNSSEKTSSTDAPNVSSSETPQNLPPVLQQLTSILPSNLEMDTTMMEHLARAAVELHHQRTGRKKSADGLLASPMTGMIGSPAAADASTSATKDKNNTKIAWTPEEQKIVETAVSEKKTTNAISKMLKNKTEAQVRAFLKNQAKTSKHSSALADDLESPSKKRGGRGRKPPTTAMNTVPNANLDAKSLLQGAFKRG